VSNRPSSAAVAYTADEVTNALAVAGVKLCRDPGVKGADESGAVDHGYWIYDAHPQVIRGAGPARYRCVPDAGAVTSSTVGIDIRSYPSSTVARTAADEFMRLGGAVVMKQSIWLWGDLVIYEIDPKASASAAVASRAVSQLPEITSLHVTGS
jgi:hypothetical protein